MGFSIFYIRVNPFARIWNAPYIWPMEFKDRLKQARREARLTQAQLAERVGIDQTSISDLERGKSLSTSYIAQIAKTCQVSPNWLATGEGNPKDSEANVFSGPKLKDKVPLISWVQAGNWQEINLYQPVETYYYCPVPHSEHTFALKVRGASMENPHSRKSFFDGDIIFVDPEKCADHNSLVVVKLDDSNEATFKQLIIEGEERYLKALNPAWPEQMIKINGNATICGVVIARLDLF